MSTSTVQVNPSALKAASYQRAVNEKKVADMVANFNPNALGAVTISKRKDGSLWVIDGRHRSMTCVNVGHSSIMAVQHEGLTEADEAVLFLELNDSRMVSAIDKFNASVVAKLEPQVNIDAILNSHGWKVRSGQGIGYIGCVDALYMIHSGAKIVPAEEGPDLLGSTIDLITKAWGHDANAAQGVMVKGLGKLLARFGSQVKIDTAVTKLQRHTPNQIIAKANVWQEAVGGNKDAALAKVVAGIYNTKQRSSRLPEWTWTR